MPTLLRYTLINTQNITTLTTATPNTYLYVYYKIVPITIIFLLQGAYKLRYTTQIHPVLPILTTILISVYFI